MHKLGDPAAGLVGCYFGPDGVGKTTYVGGLGRADSSLVVLHGTNVASWASRYPELQAEGLLGHEIPPDEAILDKIDIVTGVAMAIAGTGRRVVVDGHPLHKTTMNIAAGRLTLAGLAAGTPVGGLIDGDLLGDRYRQLLSPGINHVHVGLPSVYELAEAAHILQARMGSRPGGRSRWDPADAGESALQIRAALDLAAVLETRGHRTRQLVPPIVLGKRP